MYKTQIIQQLSRIQRIQSRVFMPQPSPEQPYLPTLLFLLEHKKHRELIKVLTNEKFSKSLLQEYGLSTQKSQLTKKDLFKISQDAKYFSVQHLIEIKGASQNKIKPYQNTLLAQCILKKLYAGQLLTRKERKLFWLQFTEIYSSPHLYQHLDDLELPSDTDQLLEKDIKRTYYHGQGNLSASEKQKKTQELRVAIKQTLSKFALYNPYILYCQGMNEIVAFLHEEGFSPCQSFYILKRITEVLLPADYYSSLQGIISFLKVLWEILAVLHPKVHQKLTLLIKELNINGSYLCVFSHCLQWFVCLFTNSSLNKEIRRIIFDFFMLEGIVVFFKVSLALFEFLEPTILAVNSFEQYVISIEAQTRNYEDVKHLQNVLEKRYLCIEIIDLLKEYSKTTQDGLLTQKISPYSKKCSRKWNICLQQLQNNIHSQHKYDFFVFKRKEQVKIIPDYLNKLDKYFFQKRKQYKPIDLFRIGRMPHVCHSSSQTCTEDSLSETERREKRTPENSKSAPLDVQRKSSLKNTKLTASYTIEVKPPRSSPKKQKKQKKPTFVFPQKGQQIFPEQNLDLSFHRKETLEYRQQIKQKLLVQTEKNSLKRSQSMMFMRMMVDNESYSNLFSLLQEQEMQQMFDINSSDEENQQEVFMKIKGKKHPQISQFEEKCDRCVE